MKHIGAGDIILGKEAVGEKLGISLATVNNWIKTQVIPPPDIKDRYSPSRFNGIIEKIKNDSSRLNCRANRSLSKDKFMCHWNIFDSSRKKMLFRLVSDFEKSGLTIDEGVLALSYALLRTNKLIERNWQINKESRIDAMLSEWIVKSKNQNVVKEIFSEYEIKNSDDDLLGAFYQSIQSISQKSNAGAYYTPPELLNGIKIEKNKTILDPCCGSGGILIRVLTKEHDHSKIFARDIDETALKICLVNLSLFFNNKNISSNILKQDIAFAQEEHEAFDCIITNPPWGSKFGKKQKEMLVKLYPQLNTAEIFSISLYRALNSLHEKGELYFFLPYAFLNVTAHRNIRKYVFKRENKVSIKLLGSAFKGVLSENILLHIENKIKEKHVFIINESGESYALPLENISSPAYSVCAAGRSDDFLLLDKIYGEKHITLKNDTIFGLGIVTGNNSKYLLKNPIGTSEAIYRGKDIQKYKLLQPSCFIEFKPELYQQTAPVYRQKKIVYRFIGDSLVCALDCGNSLLLNSANFFISSDYPMETIVSFLNSDIYTFIYRKKFHSKKVLKAHLQNLPLPILPGSGHQQIHDLYYSTFDAAGGDIHAFQDEIDRIICGAFSITQGEYSYIKDEIRRNVP
jgi:hypothetical protein